MNNTEICPLCIVSLIDDNRRFGFYENWKICPNCGYRVLKNDPSNCDDQSFDTEEHNKKGGKKSNP